jgi:benzoyl-CoA reductase/2-hydroxyglutaryl-CoA dehydratase subunit BcrC/BadD/HgdB
MTMGSMAATGQGRPTGQNALAMLRHHYEDRMAAARAWDGPDGPGGVVGVVGSAAPVEFVLAAGRLPVQVTAEPPHPTPTADAWMEDTFEWQQRSLLDRVARGDYESFELLIVTRSYHETYYYLKEIVRQGQGPQVPPLHMYDLMQSQRPAVRAYGQNRTADLLARLERLAGAPITDDQLHEASGVTNRARRANRSRLDRRRAGEVSGSTAIRAIGAGSFMHPAAFAETLEGYLSDLQPEPGLAGRPRLLVVPSEPLYHPHLHDALEAAGALVVAEDDAWGARAAGADIPEDGSPRAAIFEKYFSDLPTLEVSPRGPREAWLRQQIERSDGSDIDAVVFYVPPSDQLFGWYYPGLKEYLDQHQVPSLLVRQDVLTDEGRAAISGAAAELVGGLRPAARA